MRRLLKIFFVGGITYLGLMGIYLGMLNPTNLWALLGIVLSLPVLAPTCMFWMGVYDHWFGDISDY